MKTKYKILIIIPILYTIAALVIVAHVIENPIIANINPIFIDDQDPNYNWNILKLEILTNISLLLTAFLLILEEFLEMRGFA